MIPWVRSIDDLPRLQEFIKAVKESQGLGDVVKATADMTGISSVVGDDCGCEQRRQALNRIVPFGRTGAADPEESGPQ